MAKGDNNRLTNEEFQRRLNALGKGYYTTNKYQSMKHKMMFHCPLGHSWQAYPSNILSGRNCPICSKTFRVYLGQNDMWTTNPKQAKMLENLEDGYKYTECSGEEVWWLCPNCKNRIYSKISNVNKRGLSCPKCSDGISFPNRLMASLLLELNEYFKPEYHFVSSNYRYDFYLLNKKVIIEMHGRQHYEGWGFKNSISLEEIQENDNNKKEFATRQGIKDYIIINCRSTYYWDIIDNIKKSELSKYVNLNNLDWDKVVENAINSKIIEAVELYNNGNDTTKISKILNVSRCTVNRWLIKADSVNLCTYIKRTGCRQDEKPVILLNSKQIFDSMTQAAKETNTSIQSISKCCQGKSYFAGCYENMPAVWRFVDDYDENEIIDYNQIKYTVAKRSSTFRKIIEQETNS